MPKLAIGLTVGLLATASLVALVQTQVTSSGPGGQGPPGLGQGAVGASIGDAFYVMGGREATLPPTDAMWHYDATLDVWTPLPPAPMPRADAASVAVGNKLYIIGGTGGPCSTCGTILEYDTATGAWDLSLPSMPTAVTGASAITSNGKIMVFGGRNAANAFDGSVQVFDTDTRTWTTSLPMPTPRADAAALEFGGRIFVVGGRNAQVPALPVVEIFDTLTGQWGIGPMLPGGRHSLSLAVCGGDILAIGGQDSNGNGQSMVPRLDPSSAWGSFAQVNSNFRQASSWSMAQPLPVPMANPVRGSITGASQYYAVDQTGTHVGTCLGDAAEGIVSLVRGFVLGGSAMTPMNPMVPCVPNPGGAPGQTALCGAAGEIQCGGGPASPLLGEGAYDLGGVCLPSVTLAPGQKLRVAAGDQQFGSSAWFGVCVDFNADQVCRPESNFGGPVSPTPGNDLIAFSDCQSNVVELTHPGTTSASGLAWVFFLNGPAAPAANAACGALRGYAAVDLMRKPECSNLKDDDGDFLIDEVAEMTDCYGPDDDDETTRDCSDNLDNDSDGQTDYPADSNCVNQNDDDESGPCSNGIDDDGDGRIDTSDPGCRTRTGTSERTICQDGIDNNGDGQTDYPADAGCTSVHDNSEYVYKCNNGIDDDGDGKIDAARDTRGCFGPTDDSENDPPPRAKH